MQMGYPVLLHFDVGKKKNSRYASAPFFFAFAAPMSFFFAFATPTFFFVTPTSFLIGICADEAVAGTIAVVGGAGGAVAAAAEELASGESVDALAPKLEAISYINIVLP